MSFPRTKFDLSVIVPFLNEEENLGELIRALDAFFGGWRQISAEVIYVDDGSTDGSVHQLEKHSARNYATKIIRLSRNFGSHNAIRAGIAHAEGAVVMNFCADLQDSPHLIRKLYSESAKGFELVFATRNSVKRSWTESLFSLAYATVMRYLVYPKFPVNGTDTVLFTGKVAEVLRANVENDSSLFLQLMTMGFRQSFVSYDRNQRKSGKSKWTLTKKIKLCVDSVATFSYAPVQFVSMAGILISGMGFMWATIVVGRALLKNDLEPGWPSLIAILMIGFGVTNISLGVIGEYLWRSYNASRRRPPFIVDEISNHQKFGIQQTTENSIEQEKMTCLPT